MQFQVARLWELDAATTVEQGPPGLVALAPLMAGMTGELVEQAVQRLVDEVPPAEQADLINVLGLLSERLIGKERLTQMVTREQMLGSEFLRYVFEEELKETEMRAKAREATVLAEERARMQQMVGRR